MTSKMRPITLLIFLIMCGAGVAEGKKSHLAEQQHFSAEDTSVEKPVSIPPDVLAILSKDEMVRSALANENIPAEKIPLSWFSASAIHLRGPEQEDLVVMAEASLRGANVNTFWVFCVTAHGYALVLTAPAHDLIVKNTRWKGHRDIELTSMTAVMISTVLCRFDGEQYTQYKTKSERIR